MFENKERAEKQLLTVNPVNPSCSSAHKLYSVASIFAKLLPQYIIVAAPQKVDTERWKTDGK